ncbi:MAG TPA: IS630 family transposase [Chitinophagaceae bacterium]|nr:IS630 family transposase [Chitinophagaceae bacterium]
MRKTQKGTINCSEKDKAYLLKLSKSSTASVRAALRAKIMLRYMDGFPINEISGELSITRKTVYNCIDKALGFGPIAALADLSGRGVKGAISDDAKSWVLSVACQSPRDYGYANEVWSYSLLAKQIQKDCITQGYSNLKKAGKSVVHGILEKAGIKPHKISYYLERRDEEFDRKMAEVLVVYKEVQMANASDQKEERKQVTISYDEKPGIQAIKNIAPQLMPVIEKHATIGRDYEYKRLGTLSLLAGIDLNTGIAIPLVEEKHRSREFIKFLKKVVDFYPQDWRIKMILDNHSAHTSKETMNFLKTIPEKFEFVFTPKHGSWLNMIEMFFSKIARGFLKHMRVENKAELKERIYKGIEEINKEPIVFKWKYKMDEPKIENST